MRTPSPCAIHETQKGHETLLSFQREITIEGVVTTTWDKTTHSGASFVKEKGPRPDVSRSTSGSGIPGGACLLAFPQAPLSLFVSLSSQTDKGPTSSKAQGPTIRPAGGYTPTAGLVPHKASRCV